ncbi:helix-turn-helix transcriptional regulator [Photobacterium leiognathi]|uniref:helix-turn-helix transcriptional regulator n=1 Tax=Photobacterium leiognathi TaxID=553611 RepID=UPI0030C82675|nr:helix-turn-helix transcriptional regulator [Photobacterium leiognathi]
MLRLRIARQTYLDLESGKTEPRVSTLEKIAEIVRISICHFLNGTAKTPLDFYSNEELLAEINRRLKPEL